jgi:hypothetical protein
VNRARLRFPIACGLALDAHLAAAMVLSRSSTPAASSATHANASIFVDVVSAEPTNATSSQARGPSNVPALRSSPRRSSPPPPAAQASHALVASAVETIPTSDADRYPGGLTHPLGTSSAPVFDPNADPFGVRGGRGNGGGVELSAFAHPIDRQWRCAWPARGRASAVLEERVHIVVSVTADGRAISVTTLDDPGFDFPSAARECAMGQRYRPARDWRGRDVAGRTDRFAVIFFTW